MRRWLALLAILSGIWLGVWGEGLFAAPERPGGPAASPVTVVVAESGDPYAALAAEIAAAEGISTAESVTEALALRPTFLLWVVSPERLSDRAMVMWGAALRDTPGAPAAGILSGRTITQTRGLWERARAERSDRIFAANARFPTAGVMEGRLLEWQAGQVVTESLTVESLRQALAEAGYLTFTGHGSSLYWRIDEETKFDGASLPASISGVFSSAGCQTFRPWGPNDSLALAFVARGAAAYVGFVHSPNEGYLIGAYRDMPFRYTWPDFPIGAVVRVQNHGLQQGVSSFYYYNLLGDPRISFQAQPPYTLVDEWQEDGSWVLNYTGAPAGAIPVRIPGGAAYRFVEIPGVTAAAIDDPFYNSRLQMADIGEDKYLLFIHGGGDFRVRLSKTAPWIWQPADILLDALDHAWIYLWGGEGVAVGTILTVLAVLPALILVWRRRAAARIWKPALFGGVGILLGHAAYVLVRASMVTVISKPMVIEPLAWVETGLMAAAGIAIVLTLRSRLGWVWGLAVICLFPLGGAIFGLAGPAYFNFYTQQKIGSDIWNYSLGLLSLIAAGAGMAFWGLGLWVVKRFTDRAL